VFDGIPALLIAPVKTASQTTYTNATREQSKGPSHYYSCRRRLANLESVARVAQFNACASPSACRGES